MFNHSSSILSRNFLRIGTFLMLVLAAMAAQVQANDAMIKVASVRLSQLDEPIELAGIQRTLDSKEAIDIEVNFITNQPGVAKERLRLWLTVFDAIGGSTTVHLTEPATLTTIPEVFDYLADNSASSYTATIPPELVRPDLEWQLSWADYNDSGQLNVTHLILGTELSVEPDTIALLDDNTLLLPPFADGIVADAQLEQFRCPKGMVVVSMDVYYEHPDPVVDGIGFTCAPVNPDGTTSVPVKDTDFGGVVFFYGSPIGAKTSLFCTGGMVTGIRGRSGARVDQIGHFCAQDYLDVLNGTYDDGLGWPAGDNTGGTITEQRCPVGYAVTGADIHLGTSWTSENPEIDEIGIICTELRELLPTDDFDGDGEINYLDNCLTTANSSQLDADFSGIGDNCETVFYTSDSQTELQPYFGALGSPRIEHTFTCPQRSVLSQIDLTSGAPISSIAFGCAPLNLDGSTGDTVMQDALGYPHEFGEVKPIQVSLPCTGMITGLRGRVGEFLVEQLGHHCSDIRQMALGDFDTSQGIPFGDFAGSYAEQRCAPGSVATGAHVHVNDELDSIWGIELICTPIDPYPAAEDDDLDTYANNQDNCPADYNDTQSDHDFDGIGDECRWYEEGDVVVLVDDNSTTMPAFADGIVALAQVEEFRCPKGMVAVSMGVYYEHPVVDGIEFACAPVNPDGTTGVPVHQHSLGHPFAFGTVAGTKINLPCSGGMLTGIRGRSGARVDQIGHFCARDYSDVLNGAYDVIRGWPVGNDTGGSPTEQRCPVGYAVTGADIYLSTAWDSENLDIDEIELICTKLKHLLPGDDFDGDGIDNGLDNCPAFNNNDQPDACEWEFYTSYGPNTVLPYFGDGDLTSAIEHIFTCSQGSVMSRIDLSWSPVDFNSIAFGCAPLNPDGTTGDTTMQGQLGYPDEFGVVHGSQASLPCTGMITGLRGRTSELGHYCADIRQVALGEYDASQGIPFGDATFGSPMEQRCGAGSVATGAHVTVDPHFGYIHAIELICTPLISRPANNGGEIQAQNLKEAMLSLFSAHLVIPHEFQYVENAAYFNFLENVAVASGTDITDGSNPTYELTMTLGGISGVTAFLSLVDTVPSIGASELVLTVDLTQTAISNRLDQFNELFGNETGQTTFNPDLNNGILTIVFGDTTTVHFTFRGLEYLVDKNALQKDPEVTLELNGLPDVVRNLYCGAGKTYANSCLTSSAPIDAIYGINISANANMSGLSHLTQSTLSNLSFGTVLIEANLGPDYSALEDLTSINPHQVYVRSTLYNKTTMPAAPVPTNNIPIENVAQDSTTSGSNLVSVTSVQLGLGVYDLLTDRKMYLELGTTLEVGESCAATSNNCTGIYVMSAMEYVPGSNTGLSFQSDVFNWQHPFGFACFNLEYADLALSTTTALNTFSGQVGANLTHFRGCTGSAADLATATGGRTYSGSLELHRAPGFDRETLHLSLTNNLTSSDDDAAAAGTQNSFEDIFDSQLGADDFSAAIEATLDEANKGNIVLSNTTLTLERERFEGIPATYTGAIEGTFKIPARTGASSYNDCTDVAQVANCANINGKFSVSKSGDLVSVGLSGGLTDVTSQNIETLYEYFTENDIDGDDSAANDNTSGAWSVFNNPVVRYSNFIFESRVMRDGGTTPAVAADFIGYVDVGICIDSSGQQTHLNPGPGPNGEPATDACDPWEVQTTVTARMEVGTDKISLEATLTSDGVRVPVLSNTGFDLTDARFVIEYDWSEPSPQTKMSSGSLFTYTTGAGADQKIYTIETLVDYASAGNGNPWSASGELAIRGSGQADIPFTHIREMFGGSASNLDKFKDRFGEYTLHITDAGGNILDSSELTDWIRLGYARGAHNVSGETYWQASLVSDISAKISKRNTSDTAPVYLSCTDSADPAATNSVALAQNFNFVLAAYHGPDQTEVSGPVVTKALLGLTDLAADNGVVTAPDTPDCSVEELFPDEEIVNSHHNQDTASEVANADKRHGFGLEDISFKDVALFFATHDFAENEIYGAALNTVNHFVRDSSQIHRSAGKVSATLRQGVSFDASLAYNQLVTQPDAAGFKASLDRIVPDTADCIDMDTFQLHDDSGDGDSDPCTGYEDDAPVAGSTSFVTHITKSNELFHTSGYLNFKPSDNSGTLEIAIALPGLVNRQYRNKINEAVPIAQQQYLNAYPVNPRGKAWGWFGYSNLDVFAELDFGSVAGTSTLRFEMGINGRLDIVTRKDLSDSLKLKANGTIRSDATAYVCGGIAALNADIRCPTDPAQLYNLEGAVTYKPTHDVDGNLLPDESTMGNAPNLPRLFKMNWVRFANAGFVFGFEQSQILAGINADFWIDRGPEPGAGHDQWVNLNLQKAVFDLVPIPPYVTGVDFAFTTTAEFNSNSLLNMGASMVTNSVANAGVIAPDIFSLLPIPALLISPKDVNTPIGFSLVAKTSEFPGIEANGHLSVKLDNTLSAELFGTDASLRIDHSETRIRADNVTLFGHNFGDVNLGFSTEGLSFGGNGNVDFNVSYCSLARRGEALFRTHQCTDKLQELNWFNRNKLRYSLATCRADNSTDAECRDKIVIQNYYGIEVPIQRKFNSGSGYGVTCSLTVSCSSARLAAVCGELDTTISEYICGNDPDDAVLSFNQIQDSELLLSLDNTGTDNATQVGLSAELELMDGADPIFIPLSGEIDDTVGYNLNHSSTDALPVVPRTVTPENIIAGIDDIENPIETDFYRTRYPLNFYGQRQTYSGNLIDFDGNGTGDVVDLEILEGSLASEHQALVTHFGDGLMKEIRLHNFVDEHGEALFDTPESHASSSEIHFADFNGVGSTDVLVEYYDTSGAGYEYAWFLKSESSGPMEKINSRIYASTPSNPEDYFAPIILAGNFSNSGATEQEKLKAEILIITENYWHLCLDIYDSNCLTDTSSVFSLPSGVNFSDINDIQVGYFNDDDTLDVFLSTFTTAKTGQWIAVLSGEGAWTHSVLTSSPYQDLTSNDAMLLSWDAVDTSDEKEYAEVGYSLGRTVHLGDFNGDGLTDVLTARTQAEDGQWEWKLWSNDPLAATSAPTLLAPSLVNLDLNNPLNMFVTHLDDDNKADVFIVVPSGDDNEDTVTNVNAAFGSQMDLLGNDMWPLVPYRSSVSLSPWATLGGAIKTKIPEATP